MPRHTARHGEPHPSRVRSLVADEPDRRVWIWVRTWLWPMIWRPFPDGVTAVGGAAYCTSMGLTGRMPCSTLMTSHKDDPGGKAHTKWHPHLPLL